MRHSIKHGQAYPAVNEKCRHRDWQYLPQACHKPTKINSENGGFLRVTSECSYVANAAKK